MKKSEKILVALQIICILFSLLCIFLRNGIDKYWIAAFLFVLFLITYKYIGFEKTKIMNEKGIYRITIFFTIGFLIISYSIGLFIGFLKTPYSLKPLMIIRNILPPLLFIITSEMLRYQFCKKGSRSKLILILTVIVFSLLDIAFNISMYDLTNRTKILELICVVLIPSIFKNVMLTDFSYRYGYKITLIYSLITNLYVYFVPIFPAYDVYLNAIIDIIIPLLIMATVNSIYRKKEKEDIRDKHIISKIITIILVLFMILIVSLNSNLFRFWSATIASGSMEPTISVGDVVIIDKMYQKNLSKLEEGQVLVFSYKEKIYTHRIVKISDNNGEYYIKTKGDREGQEEDFWTVRNDDVIGVVKFKIKYIGYATVWLNEMLKGR